MRKVGLLFALLIGLLVPVVYAGNTTLVWEKDSDPSVTGYKVYQGLVSGQYGPPKDVGNVLTYSLDLIPGSADQSYYFAVTAYNAAGTESGFSNEVSKLIAAPVIAKPGTPILVVKAVDATTLQVSAASVDDGTGQPAPIDVRFGPANSLSNFGWGSAQDANCPALPCTIPNLTPGTPYEVQGVASRGPAGSMVFGALSAVVAVTTPPAAIPPPAGLTISSATPDSVVIMASVKDCKSVSTSTAGSTKTMSKRTVTCVK